MRSVLAREVEADRRQALWPVAEAASPEYRAWTDREFPIFELREG